MPPVDVQAEPKIPREVKQPSRAKRQRPTEHPHPDIPPEVIPNLDNFIIQDDTPVDGIQTERNMRLLTEPLHTSWPGPGDERPFIVQLLHQP